MLQQTRFAGCILESIWLAFFHLFILYSGIYKKKELEEWDFRSKELVQNSSKLPL